MSHVFVFLIIVGMFFSSHLYVQYIDLGHFLHI